MSTFKCRKTEKKNRERVKSSNSYYRSVPLQDLESWVSGEHGFVVFTLGSMVSDLPEEKTSIFLEAFRQIPQKVKRFTNELL